MTTDAVILDLEAQNPSDETRESAADALAFIQSLHDMFRSNGMTKNVEPDLNELENLIDALHGELAACCLFLAEPSFARVPDMLRIISAKLDKEGPEAVPLVVIQGFNRLATRVEKTRVQMQNIVKTQEST